MIARLGIVAVIVVVGIAAYQMGTRIQLSKAMRKLRDDSVANQTLLSQLRSGVPGIIYFWSPDCPPCLSIQKPTLEQLQLEFGEDGLQVVAINVYDQPQVASEWGVLSLPTTFVVDTAGSPRRVNNGVARVDKLRRQIVEAANKIS